MPKKLEYEGICATCKNAVHCVFLKNAECPVIQCEEFECFPPVTRKIVAADSSKHLGACSVTPLQEVDTTKYKGLCVNCKNRAECTFPKPEGGVWRCEEYE
ncbi:MAG: hypothetical protein JRJ87_10960 [Deltaproteobacteria bacterium]|nr:hypothetical protein [Deltaproteobacteria bacterium]